MIVIRRYDRHEGTARAPRDTSKHGMLEAE
jgi:hypothetical protein